LDRPAEDVLADVRDGFVSAKSAFEIYGVALSGDGRSVDATTTEKRRNLLPRSTKMFHRGAYYDAAEDLAR
jgi:N-methylhydantoinase B